MKLHIVTNDGELVETIDLDDYDLSKIIARAEILNTIESATQRTQPAEMSFGAGCVRCERGFAEGQHAELPHARACPKNPITQGGSYGTDETTGKNQLTLTRTYGGDFTIQKPA